MRERLLEKFQSVVQALLDECGDRAAPPDFALEVSRAAEHGDFACNAALVLAKRLGQPPRAIAERLVDALAAGEGWIERAEVAGPGFVNVWLSGERWHDLLRRVLELGSHYGHSKAGNGARVQVEFVSANPTGPLTLGHGRQAVLGDTIARLLVASGFDVTREYYFNDGGRQMRVLGDSVRARYLEQLGHAVAPPPESFEKPEEEWPEQIGGCPVAFPRDGYQGDYIVEIASELRRERGDGLADAEDTDVFRRAAEDRIFAEIRRTLTALGIDFDVFSNEMSLYEDGKVEETIEALRARDLVYEAEGAVWLRSTALGLERDRVLVRSSGEPTYLLPDIAYHREKFRRGFDEVIDVQGADHIEQFPYVQRAAGALGCPADKIELVMHQFVTLTKGGEQVKQSTRRATYVTIDDLLEEVGIDVFRFFMVQRKAEGHLDFDLDLAKETDWKKNPAYYVQYAHARTHGIERKARENGVELPDAESVDADALVLPEELDILRKIAEFPDVLRRAGETREPHHVAYYARELAGLWSPYVTVVANALALLGVSAPEQM
jgi:arginyl-tRNA synthetase